MTWIHLPNVSSSFANKIQEINDYLGILELLLNRNANIAYTNSNQEKEIKTLVPDDTHSFKASAIVMIYNMMESISTALMDDIYDHIKQSSSTSNKDFGKKKLNPVFKKSVIKFLNDKQLLIEFIEKHNGRGLDKKILSLWVENWIKEIQTKTQDGIPYNKWFNGNVDFREIKNNLTNYGIQPSILDELLNPSKKQASSLKYIKESRNRLAHGGEGFRDFGKKISYEDIEKYFKDTESLFESLFECINTHLDQQVYLQN